MLKIIFTRGAEKITATIQNSEVTIELQDGTQQTERYDQEETAALVFENNVKVLEESGYQLNTECTGELKEVFSLLAVEDRSFVRIKKGQIEKFFIYEADSISVWDGMYPPLKKAKPIGYFNPEKADPELFGIHCLRRFTAHPASAKCTEFGLCLSMKIDEALTILKNSSRANVLTHLEVLPDWNRGKPKISPRDLSLEFPQIRRLCIPDWAFTYYFTGIYQKLDWLILGAFWENPPAPPAPTVTEYLYPLAKYAPSLRILSIPMSGYDLGRLAGHPLTKQLEVLDLRHMSYCDYNQLLRLNPYLKHLKMIILDGHLIHRRIKQLFKNWKAILFAEYDGRNPPLRKLRKDRWVFMVD